MANQKKEALNQWKKKTGQSSKYLYKWIREESPIMPLILPDRKGKPTGDPVEQLKAAFDAWKPYLKRYDLQQLDTEMFITEYKSELDALKKTQLNIDFNKHSFYQTIQGRKSCAAGGIDSWRTHEIQRLPKEIIFLLAELLQKGESIGTMPRIMSTGITKFLSKGKGTAYLALRPITLMTVAYAAWSTYRGREIAEHLETVLPDNLFGGRKGRSTANAEIPGAIEIETNKYLNTPLIGTSEDYNKCFDTITAKLAIAIWDYIGVNPNVVKGIRSIYDQHSRIFSINGQAGDEFNTCSLVQGCAFSLHMVNTIFAILALRISKVSPDVNVQFFVDDSKTKATINAFDQLLKVKQERCLFNSLAGLILNPSKCTAWGTTLKARELAKQLLPPQGQIVKYFPSLGYLVNTTKGIRRLEQNKRCANAYKVIEKISKLKCSREKIETALSACAITKLTYGSSVCLPSNENLSKVTTAILKACWSKDQKLREPNLVFLVMLKAHRLHPKLACYWEALKNLRNCLLTYPNIKKQIAAHWDTAPLDKPGPISVIKTIFYHLHCDLDSYWNVIYEEDSFNFLNTTRSTWGHNVRTLFKRFLVSSVKNRSDWTLNHKFSPYLEHIYAYINPIKTTTKFIVKQAISWTNTNEKSVKPMIETICSGSFRTASRLKAAKLVSDDICPHCKTQRERHQNISGYHVIKYLGGNYL